MVILSVTCHSRKKDDWCYVPLCVQRRIPDGRKITTENACEIVELKRAWVCSVFDTSMELVSQSVSQSVSHSDHRTHLYTLPLHPSLADRPALGALLWWKEAVCAVCGVDCQRFEGGFGRT